MKVALGAEMVERTLLCADARQPPRHCELWHLPQGKPLGLPQCMEVGVGERKKERKKEMAHQP
jgi:hypothetical protein